ncbi:MAG TPA: sugar transferase [Solirubrobacteraceae bacterium]|nr:sugar transferase [Solirubrobacteraceae bacterium]
MDQPAPFLTSALERPVALPVACTASVWPIAKRTFDALFAAALLLAMLPVLIAIAIAIKVDSRGPVFHRVRRVGYRGRPLHMLKFRKMHHDAQGGPLTTTADPRLTRVGALLTRTRLDELPQLWDVLRGRMSIVGPRPEDPIFVSLHPEQYEAIHSVRPGITGITQLAFAAESSILAPEDPITDYVNRILPGKVTLDVLYARKNRLRLDASVLFWTIAAVIMGRPVAVNRATGRMNTRRRQPAPRLTMEIAGASCTGQVPTPRLSRVLFRRGEMRTLCAWRARGRMARRGRAD